jgi:hypothetical protein
MAWQLLGLPSFVAIYQWLNWVPSCHLNKQDVFESGSTPNPELYNAIILF